MSKRLEPILAKLAAGETIHSYKESGNSMTPIIKHQQPVTLAPVDSSKLEVGDVVLSKVSGRFFLHKVSAIKQDQVQISNNKGHVNGWTSKDKVYGIVIAVDGVPRSGASGKVKQKEGVASNEAPSIVVKDWRSPFLNNASPELIGMHVALHPTYGIIASGNSLKETIDKVRIQGLEQEVVIDVVPSKAPHI